jgi:hypothetical protein
MAREFDQDFAGLLPDASRLQTFMFSLILGRRCGLCDFYEPTLGQAIRPGGRQTRLVLFAPPVRRSDSLPSASARPLSDNHRRMPAPAAACGRRSLVPYAYFLYFTQWSARRPRGKNSMKIAFSHPQTDSSTPRTAFQDGRWRCPAITPADGLTQFHPRARRWSNRICSQRT